jgi:cardiolipin synthase A/B
VPEGAFRHALYGAARRGVRVRVLVPFRGDVAIVQMAQEALYQGFLDAGIEVYLLRGSVLHSKSAIVDGHFVTLGSYNFDERSRSKNLELNLAVEDPEFASHAGAMFDAYLASSERLTRETWAARGAIRRGVELVSFTLRRFL